MIYGLSEIRNLSLADINADVLERFRLYCASALVNWDEHAVSYFDLGLEEAEEVPMDGACLFHSQIVGARCCELDDPDFSSAILDRPYLTLYRTKLWEWRKKN